MPFFELLPLENFIIKLFNQPIHPVVNNLVILLNYSVYIFLVALLIYYYKQKVGILFWKRRRREFIHLIFNAAIGFTTLYFLKYAVGRPRPSDRLFQPIIHKPDPSFPSMHTFISFLALRFLPKEFPAWLKTLSILYLVVAIPISALYLGIHYPSDLLAGAVLGLIFPSIFTSRISHLAIKKFYKLRALLSF